VKESIVKKFISLVKSDPFFYAALAAGLIVGLPVIGYLGWQKTQVIAAGCDVSPMYQWACGWYRWMAENPYHYAGVLIPAVAIALLVPYLRFKHDTKKYKRR
jgi:hypothetical protein